MKKSFKIGELAKRVGVSVQTIRYYENEGLIQVSHRTPGGYRCFDEQALQTIEYIRYYQSLGFILKEIRILLVYEKDPETYCEQARAIFCKKIKSVQDNINNLSGKKEMLEKKLENCEMCREKSTCRVLKENINSNNCSKKT